MSTNSSKPSFDHVGTYGRLRVLLREAHRKGNRFCFVLGAGASRSSGIPAGGELAKRWLVEHYRIEHGTDPQPNDPLLADLGEAGHEAERIKDATFQKWISNPPLPLMGMTLSTIEQFYSHIYALRFEGAEDQGHDYLRRIIQGKRPSIGYAYLARLMAGAPYPEGSENGHRSHSPHNVVVTVNFDNLIAEALVLYEKRYSVVCGHEVMAAEIHPAEEIPLVIKLHADLMLRPRSRPQDIKELASPWKELLRRFGQSHRFIFLGYGGNDPGFMGFLANELKPNDLEYEPWWGYYTPDPKTPDETRQPDNPLVAQFLNSRNGTLFPVPAFDLMMHALLEDTATPHPQAADVENRASEIVTFFREGETQLIAELGGKTASDTPSEPARAVSNAAPSLKTAATTKEKTSKEQKRSAREWILRAFAAPSVDEAILEFEAGRKEFPEDHALRCNYAAFLQSKQLEPERVDELYAEIQPDTFQRQPSKRDGWWLGNYAVFLMNRGRFEEAESVYKRALEADPKNAICLGNYAVFLVKQQRFQEAESFYKRALEADPKHANSLGDYAVFLMNRERFDEAESFYKRALEADPKHANSLGNYAVFLMNRERFEEAESFYKRALEADPEHANNLGNYARLLAKRERFEEAESFYKRALEADPKHANSLGNYAQFLFILGRLQEAEGRSREAEVLSPTQKDLLVELAFYRAAHIRADWPQILARLKELIGGGARSPGWNLQPNIEVAAKAGHPNVPLLEALATVITAGTDPATLDAFPEWRTA